MSRENVDYVRRSQEAWNEGDMEPYLAATPPDAEWVIAEENPPDEPPAKAPETPVPTPPPFSADEREVGEATDPAEVVSGGQPEPQNW